ncbi:hypothetical protein SAMN02745121_05693 [Nannocystis exedens]|uniref:Uncharacterized protein n=1 Tax=Nannocystis exedens TaxID=54 RepID=A0A1I2DRF2_9BACT|nr:hypothetical protein [Nannocystis exedens]PCC68974.1 hypothetical protein NAEX_01996 [Nannocystis exedens]SFE82883.1 hypothetical protein SAMN02745121_05693 [Nannocystis exedens]
MTESVLESLAGPTESVTESEPTESVAEICPSVGAVPCESELESEPLWLWLADADTLALALAASVADAGPAEPAESDAESVASPSIHRSLLQA